MEEQNQVIKKEKKGVPVIVVIILIVLFCGLGIFIGTKTNIFKNIIVTEQDEKNKNTEKEKEEAQEEVQEESTQNIPEGCINKPDYIYNEITDSPITFLGIKSYKLTNNNKSAILTINGETYFSTLNSLQPADADGMGGTYTPLDYELTINTNKEIAAVIASGIGQGITGDSEYVLFLMKDGTIQYTKLFNKNTDSRGNIYFTANLTEAANPSLKTVDGISDITKISSANSHAPNSTGSGTIIAYVNDKSFYDLNEYIS